MSKSKKNKPSGSRVKLSQCMIVKNEEKNIERALGWAKPVAYEQIVVDTGSTDRTVELAKQLGATVYHFEWINDFSAAKNYAIEQATGNWIAFLDADEYFSAGDTAKLMEKLKIVEEHPEELGNITVLNMPWVQLNDEGEAFSVYKQSRIFRNIKQLRYVNKIHEHLTGFGTISFVEDISIMHTGYAKSSYEETSKLERNIELLRTELVANPDNINAKAYLADSLSNRATLANPEKWGVDPEADVLFADVLNSDVHVFPVLKKKAYTYFIAKYLGEPDKYDDCEEMCNKALEEYSGDLDFWYFLANIYNKKGEYERAWEQLKKLEAAYKDSVVKHDDSTIFLNANPILIYEQMLGAAQGMGDIEHVIKYATIVLISNKMSQRILSPYIYTLTKHGVPEDEILGLLGKIYDISNPQDLLFIVRSAKDCGAVDFARMIMIIAGELLGNNPN
jgi:glycosyltransferase involved in cell wall biosynthesis